MHEHLNDALDASAPPRTDIDRTALRAMLRDARAAARPRPRRRRAVVGGVLALVLVGGAGAAVASSDWSWIDGLENPDRSYTYTAPTWGECEIRFSALDTHNPLIQGEVDRVIDEWFATTDVEAAAAPFVAKHLAQLESDQAAAEEEITDPRLPDLNAWTAHEQALQEALYEELSAHGFSSLPGAESHSQVHCDREDWGAE